MYTIYTYAYYTIHTLLCYTHMLYSYIIHTLYTLYTIYTLYTGDTLSYHLSKKRGSFTRPFTELRYLRMAREFADALSYLHYDFHHECMIIHRGRWVYLYTCTVYMLCVCTYVMCMYTIYCYSR